MKRIYPIELVQAMHKFNYIPRVLNPNEHLKLYHRYWIPDLGGLVKVKDVWKDSKIEYYLIRCKNDMYVCCSHPISNIEDSYELLHDYDDIYKDNIINNHKSYTGAEIKYWFTLNYDKSYEKFSKYLNQHGKMFLNDNRRYKVTINSQNKYYINPDK